jgi:cell division protein FtsN
MAAKNTHRFELRMGKLGLALFILGMSALLFAVFLFGVNVGKNIDTYPDKIARFIPDTIRGRMGWPSGSTEPMVSPKEEKKQETAESDKDMNLTFYDTLAKKKGDTRGLIVETPKEKTTEAERLREPSLPVAPAANLKMPAEKAAAANQQKPAALPPAPPPAAVQKKEAPVAKDKFLIQVVSYQKKSTADDLIGKLKSLGYTSRIEVMELPDKGKWFRVVMGGFQSKQDAQKAVDKVSKSIAGVHCVIRSVESKKNP